MNVPFFRVYHEDVLLGYWDILVGYDKMILGKAQDYHIHINLVGLVINQLSYGFKKAEERFLLR